MTCLFRVSFLITLVIYKAYFKSHQTWKQRLRTHILCKKLLHLYVLGFVTKCFLIFIVYEVKNFATKNNQSSYWSLSHTRICAKELVTNWRFVESEEVYYTIKSNWVLERRFNCRLVFWDRLG